MQNNQFDYIISGMGCAGLSLAVRLIDSGLPFSKVLIIDKDQKNRNDRTWCFWTKEKTPWYNDIIFKKWNQLAFKSQQLDLKLKIEPSSYCLIRGIDFYNFCLQKIKKDNRFKLAYDEIESIESSLDGATLKTSIQTYNSKFIFNSAIRSQNIKPNHINYVQHFKGYLVKFDKAIVDETCPVFMDFNVEQKNDCRFIYQIPFSNQEVLIEYTGFSKEAISEQEYDFEIKEYIARNYPGHAYEILETERGQIPMHESQFINPFGKNIINIGTAGGASKGSSGYTFYFIQKQIESIVTQLKNNCIEINLPEKAMRFQYYDKVLLEVINRKAMMPKEIFEILFKSNHVLDILDFLNEESNLKQELKIINSLPKKYFLVAGMKKAIG